MYVGNFLHRVGSGGTPLQFIVVGFVPSDWEGDGHHSPLGDTAVDVVDNTSELHRAQQKWAYLSQVLGQDGEDACMSGIFYTALVQVVLLYSS